MSNLLSVTKSRDDSNHDKIMVNKSQLQKAVDSMKAVGGGQDDAINGEAIDKVFAARSATGRKTALERHATALKNSELVSYISMTDAVSILEKISID